MVDKLLYYFTFDFVINAFIVGTLIALCAALLGSVLVLKRYSFIGTSLSHVAFLTTAITTVMGVMENMLVVMIVNIVAAILLLRPGRKKRENNDAILALVSVGALALGYMTMSLFSSSGNVAADVCTTLFGSTLILTLTKADVWITVIVSVIVVGFFIISYNKIFALTFDESFAKVSGVNVSRYNLIMAVIIAVVIVLAIKLVGSLLMTALIICPALSGMSMFRSFKGVVIFSACSSILMALIGMLISILLSTPVGSTIVVINILVYLVCYSLGKIGGNRG